MSSAEKTSLLLVDDDRVFRERIARAFTERGFETRTAHDVESALAIAREESAELAVVDLKMPGRSGLDLVRELLEIDPATRIVVLTGYGSIATAVEAIRLGATHYLPKPADVDDILEAFSRNGVAVAAPEAEEIVAPSLARAEWEHINRVLADCNGNISAAARRLGIHRRSLQRKLQKFPPAE
ncbi:MAG TPA: response regulator transcription factor [bacterium]|nr:response regulator transcription factor [bacterium]